MAQSESMNENTQSKYRRKRNTSTDKPLENEVRITTQGSVKRYVDYAVRLLTGPQQKDKGQENENDTEQKVNNENENTEKTAPTKQFDTIVLKATGRAIYSAVTTAEVVKRKIANLHQMTKLDTLEMIDVWEPLEEGLKEVQTTRRVASICITLSRDPSKIDSNAVGYQEPIPAESVGATRGRGRGRGRGRANFRGNAGMDNRRSYGRGNQGMRGRRQAFNNERGRNSYPIRRGGYGRGFGQRQGRDEFGGGSRQRGGMTNNRQFNNRR